MPLKLIVYLRVEGRYMEVRIDADRLRDYMVDRCGTAAFSGFPAAIADAWETERIDGCELCRFAERQGIDLRRFQL